MTFPHMLQPRPYPAGRKQGAPSSCWVLRPASGADLIRVDGCRRAGPARGLDCLSREASGPENCQNCRTEEQKIADDKFFRTTLCLPVVADCEIMDWAFWEYALLIWVCLVVYTKPSSPPTAPSRPSSPEEAQLASKARSAEGGGLAHPGGRTGRH